MDQFKRALRLEYFTVGYNVLEALLSILFGSLAGSIALVGFGLDSIVESLSGLILIWRLRIHGKISEETEERIESRAEKFVGLTFFILGVYILIESFRKIVIRDIPDPSLPGIGIALLSLIVMPILAYQKYSLGKELQLRSLIADSKETLVCAFLSVALLLGLVLNAAFGFWMADPIVGFIIVLFLFREGYELIVEKGEDKRKAEK